MPDGIVTCDQSLDIVIGEDRRWRWKDEDHLARSVKLGWRTQAQADAIRTQTVEQARRMLNSGKSADEVIDYLANTLTNRLLHTPTQALRRASESADPALAQLLVRLLSEERDRRPG